MTVKDAYQYFVLKAQEIALSNDWIPVNWYVRTIQSWDIIVYPVTF